MCKCQSNNNVKTGFITSLGSDTLIGGTESNPFQDSFTTGAVSTPVSNNSSNITVAGRVIDFNGYPARGVNISILGTRQGAATDSNGRFSIANVNPGATVQFSMIGKETETYIANSIPREITLFDSVTDLDPVVVTAGPVREPFDLTAAVTGALNNGATAVSQTPVADPKTSKMPLILGIALGGTILYNLFSGSSSPQAKPVDL